MVNSLEYPKIMYDKIIINKFMFEKKPIVK